MTYRYSDFLLVLFIMTAVLTEVIDNLIDNKETFILEKTLDSTLIEFTPPIDFNLNRGIGDTIHISIENNETVRLALPSEKDTCYTTILKIIPKKKVRTVCYTKAIIKNKK